MDGTVMYFLQLHFFHFCLLNVFSSRYYTTACWISSINVMSRLGRTSVIDVTSMSDCNAIISLFESTRTSDEVSRLTDSSFEVSLNFPGASLDEVAVSLLFPNCHRIYDYLIWPLFFIIPIIMYHISVNIFFFLNFFEELVDFSLFPFFPFTFFFHLSSLDECLQVFKLHYCRSLKLIERNISTIPTHMYNYFNISVHTNIDILILAVIHHPC